MLNGRSTGSVWAVGLHLTHKSGIRIYRRQDKEPVSREDYEGGWKCQ